MNGAHWKQVLERSLSKIPKRVPNNSHNPIVGGLKGLYDGASPYGKTLASIPGAFVGLGKGLNTTAKGIGSAITSGLKTVPKNATLGEKVYGATVKGGAVAAGGYGLYQVTRAVDNISRMPTSGPNYTTALRNRLLAGEMQPGELTVSDMKAVRKLGLG